MDGELRLAVLFAVATRHNGPVLRRRHDNVPVLSRRQALCWGIAAVCAGRSLDVHGQPLPRAADGRVEYYIATGEPSAGFRATDAQLATWALEAWQRAARGKLSFVRTTDENRALIRVFWAPAAGGQYGQMVEVDVAGSRGAAVFVRPDTAALGGEIAARAAVDALFRDAIVYLTCLHELGHALGLRHTGEFADIMYSFGFGGDILQYFARYRRQIHTRADIGSSAGLSPGDLEQLHTLYPGPGTD